MTKNKVILFIVSVILTFILTWTFFRYIEISFFDFTSKIARVKFASLLTISLFTFANFLTISIRWRYISQKIGITKVPFLSYLFYVSFGAVLGLVLPQQISLVVVRSLSLRFVSGSSLKRSGFSVFYDMVFTSYPVLLLGIVSLLSSYCMNFIHFVILNLTVFIGGYLCINIFTNRFSRLLLFVYSVLKRKDKDFDIDAGHNIASVTTSLFRSDVTFFLFCLGFVQNIILVARNWYIASAGGFDITFEQILYSYPLVYISMIVGITPGGFGVIEWAWTGALSLLGLDAIRAGEYALFNRIMVLSSQLGIFVLLTISVFLAKKKR